MIEYRLVPGFETYCVGDDGTVWTRRVRGSRYGGLSDQWTPMALTPFKNGYLCVTLRRDGKSFKRTVHSLVLTSFRGPPGQEEECRHFDRDTHNNRLSNLFWGSCQENANDRIRHGTSIRGADHIRKLTPEAVRDCRERFARGASCQALADEHGVHRMTMRSALVAKTFRYVDKRPG